MIGKSIMYINMAVFTVLFLALIIWYIDRKRRKKRDDLFSQIITHLADENFTQATAAIHALSNQDGYDMAVHFQKSVNQMFQRHMDAEQSRRELENVLGALQDAVLVVDEQTRLRYINPAAVAMFDLHVDTALGLQLIEALPSFDIDTLLRQTLEEHKSTFKEMTLYLPDAMEVQTRIWPMSGAAQDRPGGAVIVIGDLSELRRATQVRREFVANASHELRTPIANIHAMAETLSESPNDADLAARFNPRLLEESELLSRLVNDLLSLAQVERNVQPNHQEINLTEVLNAAKERLQKKAQLRQIEIDVNATPQVTVNGNAAQLEQMVLNLLENAIAYSSDNGTVKLELSQNDGEAIFSCQDSGIGIPAEEKDRIFERFYRVDKARSKAQGGTGLGLAIVKHVVENHDGTVTVDSELEQGTTFTVRLAGD